MTEEKAESSALVYVTNQCNSNCIMCPDSVKLRTRPNEVTRENLLEQIGEINPEAEHVDITGGEPTLLKEQLPELIEAVFRQAPDAEVLMLSNGRSFAAGGYTERFSAFAHRRLKIEIPIHGDCAELHDRIAGCPESFVQTRAGIHHLLEAGVEVGIRIVVSRLNYSRLNELIRFISREFPEIKYVNLMGMEVLGNAWKNREQVWIEFDEVKDSLQQAVEQCFACGIIPSLYNYPLCLFDRKYWYCYRNSISDYKIRYFEECEKCTEKSRCGGFFASTYRYTRYKVRVQV
ncbi:His-Xaa-Ser system radical SAM maturase HxsC [Jingyaoa shaoxingensis]|uniref:His-Xaa-Ser system radical SAM maturase HxsC n=1 Tax=Jingyaoa shaoxingensis TaxID=2763671 RepID=A0ABR7NBB2_9FIRM|nr:His-Xaa-Ser system radical SAM maturase HxsC [Jingyaoa shaoxingensis]MBC8573013.1 His-Xaa-Ser system radical SAM maturase HxsC [Jingyaoa shaoxingensis]